MANCAPECGRLLEPSVPNLGEPDAAVDSSDPQRMAVIAQAQGPKALLSPPGVAIAKFVLFTTSDGGATWMSQPLPDLDGPGGGNPVEGQVVSDPQVAFGASGRLYAGGMVTGGFFGGTTYLPFLVASDDLGVTWGPAVLFEAAYNVDGPKLAADATGHVALVWTEYDGEEVFAPGWAWSGDDGTTWESGTFGLPGAEDCSTTHVRIVLVEEGFVAGCTLDGGGAVIGRWSPSGGWLELATLGAQWASLLGLATVGTQTVALVGNTLSMSFIDVELPGVFQVRVREVVHSEDAVEHVLVTAFAADGNGGLHLLFRQLARLPGGGFTYGAVTHVAWDWYGKRLVADDPLTSLPASPAMGRAVVVDDYHGLDFQTAHGLMAWGDEGAIHWATLSPPA